MFDPVCWRVRSCFVMALLLLAGCSPAAPPAPQAHGAATNSTAAKDAEGSHTATTSDLAEIRQALDKLSLEDRILADAQGFCPLSEEPLGSMGVPVKIMIRNEPVFLCCDGCSGHAADHADETLAKVAQQKARVEKAKPAG